MKKVLLLFAFMFSFGFIGANASPEVHEEEEVVAPCSTRYEIYVDGQFIGTETVYNYSLSCSGQEHVLVHVEHVPILA